MSAAEQAPQVGHIEEVRTSSEERALVSDYRHITDSTKQSNSDETCSDGSSDLASSQQNSAVPSNSSVNTDSTAAVSCSEPQSSDVATAAATSSTPPSASNDKPDAEADDDNPELTLLVVTATDAKVYTVSERKLEYKLDVKIGKS